MGALLSIQLGRMRTINCITVAAVISAIGKCVIKGWRDDTDYFLVTTTKSRKVTATVSLKECQFFKRLSWRKSPSTDHLIN